MFINFCQTQSPYVLQRRRSSLLPWGGDASALVLLWVSAFTGTMLVISRYSSRLYFTITFSYIPLCVALAVPLHTQALTHEKKEQEWKQHKKCGETISKSTVNFLFGCQCYAIAVAEYMFRWAHQPWGMRWLSFQMALADSFLFVAIFLPTIIQCILVGQQLLLIYYVL